MRWLSSPVSSYCGSTQSRRHVQSQTARAAAANQYAHAAAGAPAGEGLESHQRGFRSGTATRRSRSLDGFRREFRHRPRALGSASYWDVIRAPGFAPSPAKKPLDPYRELISHQVGNIVYNETWGLYDNDSKPESNPELDSARFAISHATRSGEHWLDPPSHVTDLVRSVPPEALGTYRTCQRIAEAADREREHGMDSDRKHRTLDYELRRKQALRFQRG